MSFEETNDGPVIARDAGLPASEEGSIAQPSVGMSNMPTVAATKVENIPGVRSEQVGNLGLSELQRATKEKLDAEPRVPITIPLDPGEKIGAYRSVSINTYRMEIKKNALVYVPMSVAHLILSSLGTTIEALENHPRNLQNQSADVKAALGIA